MVIERKFRKTKSQEIKIAREELKFCVYSGKGGCVALKDFLSKFGIIMNKITEAGGQFDDSIGAEAFERV